MRQLQKEDKNEKGQAFKDLKKDKNTHTHTHRHTHTHTKKQKDRERERRDNRKQ